MLLVLKENTAIRRRSRGRWRVLDAIHIRRSDGQRFLVQRIGRFRRVRRREREREKSQVDRGRGRASRASVGG